MKLLFDEPVPRQLRARFPAGFEIATAQEMGWASIDNGQLLRRAANRGFDAIITLDQNIRHQQNVAALPLPVIILSVTAKKVAELESLVPMVVDILRGDLQRRCYQAALPPSPRPAG